MAVRVTSASINHPLVKMAPLIVAAMYAFIVITCWGNGHFFHIIALFAGYTSAIMAAMVFTASVVLIHAFWARDARAAPVSITSLVSRFVTDRWRADQGLSLWQPLLTFIILMTAFTFFKQSALREVGFGWGPWIADADQMLFITDPWRITHAVFASAWWTQAFDLAYHAWFAPTTLGVAFCAFARPGSVLSWRYLLTYCLLWIVLGSILAYAFPAAGPAYCANFQYQPHRFEALTQLLSTQDTALRAQGAPGLSALVYQRHLLLNFQQGAFIFGGGISAMPSLHNALVVLFACAAGHLSPTLGRIMVGYAAIVWIGSIHLGWHYGLDGIVALVATIGLWKCTGLIGWPAASAQRADRWRAPPVARAFFAKRKRRYSMERGR